MTKWIFELPWNIYMRVCALTLRSLFWIMRCLVMLKDITYN